MNAQDLQRIEAGTRWREHRIEVFHDTSVGSVLVKGQRAAPAAWRRRTLNSIARLVRLPLLAAAPAPGGAEGQRIEVQRLRALAAAGAAVPAVLHVADDYFVQQFLAGEQLTQLLRGPLALHWWRRGLDTLVDLHRRGQYLSQAFSRNFITANGKLVMIDFEDDPLQAMSIDEAQSRDWLAYLHSTAKDVLPEPQSSALLHEALQAESAKVRASVDAVVRRLSWLQRLRVDNRPKTWRRHVTVLQAALTLVRSAQPHPR
jgi:tRNA A-37 threonylcarbamoyl transferase component Bud32